MLIAFFAFKLIYVKHLKFNIIDNNRVISFFFCLPNKHKNLDIKKIYY